MSKINRTFVPISMQPSEGIITKPKSSEGDFVSESFFIVSHELKAKANKQKSTRNRDGDVDSYQQRVLLVPPPGSSVLGGKSSENQRWRLTKQLATDGYTVLTMIPPGKNGYLGKRGSGSFSFEKYARSLQSVLRRYFVVEKPIGHIVTSSLGQLPVISALTHERKQPSEEYTESLPKNVIIGAPIDDLATVLQSQKKVFGTNLTEQQILAGYAQQNKLNLDPQADSEIVEGSEFLSLGLDQLLSDQYFSVSVYGNQGDLYFPDGRKKSRLFRNSHFFEAYKSGDPFFHEFVQKNADEALKLVSAYLQPNANQGLKTNYGGNLFARLWKGGV